MGNCCRHESSMRWASDDWGSLAGETRNSWFSDEAPQATTLLEKEKEKLLQKKSVSSPSSSSSSSKEVKIKISKKQFDELVGKLDDLQGLSVGQILAQLMNVNDQYKTHHQRPWKPALQSIPEVN